MKKHQDNLLGLLGVLTPAKVLEWAKGGSSGSGGMDKRKDAVNIFDANVIGSKRTDGIEGLERHAVLLDLDVPAYLIPSSTEGHSHLYIDVSVGRSSYFKLLDALAECKVIEQGYCDASKTRGATYLRLPWVKKPDTAQAEPEPAF